MDAVALILTYGIKYGPDVARLVSNLFHAPVPPTPADYEALFVLMSKTGESYFEAAKP